MRLLKSVGTLFLFLLLLLALSLVSRSIFAGPAEGRALFEARCVSCHGMEARGSVEAAKRLKVDPVKLDLTKDPVSRRSPAALRKLVAGGHGRMPRQESLTPSQVSALVQYLKSLQKAFVLVPQKDRVDR